MKVYVNQQSLDPYFTILEFVLATDFDSSWATRFCNVRGSFSSQFGVDLSFVIKPVDFSPLISHDLRLDDIIVVSCFSDKQDVVYVLRYVSKRAVMATDERTYRPITVDFEPTLLPQHCRSYFLDNGNRIAVIAFQLHCMQVEIFFMNTGWANKVSPHTLHIG